MKVQDIMTNDVQCCGPGTNLAAAAKMMWDGDCGVLPVVDLQGRVTDVDHGSGYLYGSRHEEQAFVGHHGLGNRFREGVHLPDVR